MKKKICSLLLCLCAAASQAQTGKTILAIFAHPDDEESAGPVLAKYAREGGTVYIAVATDGGLGVSQRAGIPAGDSLVKIRTREMRDAARVLGAQPPIFFGLHDQLDMEKGLAAQYTVLDSLRKKIAALFVRLQPDAVITWGPSGWTGHPDHRLVGDMVTEVFQSMHWRKRVILFYPEIPSGSLEKGGPRFATVDSSYLNVRILLSARDIRQCEKAWACHQSQYTSHEVKKMVDAIWSGAKPVAWFRALEEPNRPRSSLLDW